MLHRLTPLLSESNAQQMKSYSVTIWMTLILKSTGGTGNAQCLFFLTLSKWNFESFFSFVLGALESERVKEMYHYSVVIS